MRAENDAFTYQSIGDQYRAKTKKRKIKLTPSDDRNELEYLQSLVILMMKADSRRGGIDNETLKLTGE
jgi:asparagine synthetase A